MKTFSALLAFCAWNSPVPGEFPAQRPVMLSFDVFFDLRLINYWLNNREAGDLRCYRSHYDVTVMCYEDETFSLIYGDVNIMVTILQIMAKTHFPEMIIL